MTHLKDKKYFLPLESNPDVFTQLMHNLGVSSALAFHDVLSIDDKELLQLVPRPALALVLLFPTLEDHEVLRKAENEAAVAYDGSGEDEDVIWFKQTIGNACGLYALLHAITNGRAREYIGKNTLISRLLKECVPRDPNERALVLEESSELQRVHTSAAVQGDTVPPESAKAEVDFHYVCFVPSHRNGHLYEMDGDKWGGPIDLGVHLEEGEDLLTERVLEVVRAFVQRNKHNEGFSLMALVEQERK
ncbi:ubiquitin carboxyl-terminal hydrolase [Irpex lacteus]|nr:ubiquitin carboxyl-terminal hydrolase [Irpex lacteus]